MMSPKKGSRQAMKHPSTIRNVLDTRRTMVFLKLHTGACKQSRLRHQQATAILTFGIHLRLAAAGSSGPCNADILLVHPE